MKVIKERQDRKMKETEVGTPATRSFLHSFPLFLLLSLLLPHTHRHPRASVTQKQNSDECLSQIKFSFDRAFIAAYEFYSLYFGGKMLLYGCEGFTFFFFPPDFWLISFFLAFLSLWLLSALRVL